MLRTPLTEGGATSDRVVVAVDPLLSVAVTTAD
jgi:hypothetical protein